MESRTGPMPDTIVPAVFISCDLNQSIARFTRTIFLTRERLCSGRSAVPLQTDYGTECPRGQHWIMAPRSSEYVEHGVHQLWQCSKCGYEFDTAPAGFESAPLSSELIEE